MTEASGLATHSQRLDAQGQEPQQPPLISCNVKEPHPPWLTSTLIVTFPVLLQEGQATSAEVSSMIWLIVGESWIWRSQPKGCADDSTFGIKPDCVNLRRTPAADMYT